MMDILTQIVAHKKKEVAAAQARVPLDHLRAQAAKPRPSRAFQACLAAADGLHIIAEIKRASPSKGAIRPDLDPRTLALAYQSGGAAALSVLTDQKFFGGLSGDLHRAREAVDLPVLRKDFTVSAYQIYESAVLKADAILLIVRILTSLQLERYLAICQEVGLDALVEAHSAEEIDLAVAAGARVIGINSRDLKTFTTDLNLTLELAGRLPSGCIAVAESGIQTSADIRRLSQAGINNFLIGESLVRVADPARHLKILLGTERFSEPAPGRSP